MSESSKPVDIDDVRQFLIKGKAKRNELAADPPADGDKVEEIEPLTPSDEAILDPIWARIALERGRTGKTSDLAEEDDTDDE